jgi:hypothetical protein
MKNSIRPYYFGGELTIWDFPDANKFKSQFGFTTYGNWCRLESNRMNKAGGKTEVIKNNGLVCIAKLPVTSELIYERVDERKSPKSNKSYGSQRPP